jgi:5-methylcytosine-specific restriction enzyme A
MKLRSLRPLISQAPGRVTALDQLPKVRAFWYGTPEHRAWSALVVKRANGVCQCCGKPTKRLIADHVNEIKDGGDPLDPMNGEAQCWPCHNVKTALRRRERALGLLSKTPQGEAKS